MTRHPSERGRVKLCHHCSQFNIKRDLIVLPLPMCFGLYEQLSDQDLAEIMDDLIHECARRAGTLPEVAEGV